jgi:rSAM/selenodomain-associated transferase 1
MRPPHDTVAPAGCVIAVMAKASIPGKVKTRLVPPLTAEQAGELNTAFLRDIIENIDAAARYVDVAACVAYGPAGSYAFFRSVLPPRVGLLECALPNFGDCLYLAIGTLLDRGHGSVCVINSDSPTLPTAALIEAVRILGLPGDRAVLGPCLDGGYYLLGLKQPHRQLFEHIDWSTERVFDQTCGRAADIGLPLALLEPWYDVDDVGALRRLHEELFVSPRTESARRHAAPHAHAALQRMLHSQGVAGWLDPGMKDLPAVRDPAVG